VGKIIYIIKTLYAFSCVVKFYNATSSLVRFESKNIFIDLEKDARAYFNAGFVIVNSNFVGLAPGFRTYGKFTYMLKGVFKQAFEAAGKKSRLADLGT
jgi:hypothetical protein